MPLRTLIVLLLLALLVAMAPITIYTVHFANSGKFSSVTETWGAFGSFLGGTLGPVLAYFAFAVLLANYRTQQQTLKLAERTAAQQWDYLQRKEKRDEWRDAIRDAKRLLEDHLNIVEAVAGGLTDRGRLLQQIYTELIAAGKSYDAACADVILAKYTKDVRVDHFKPTAALVCDIWELLDGYLENITEKDSRLFSFYMSYFQGVTTRLHTIGAISDHYWKSRLGKVVAKISNKGAGFAVPVASDTNAAPGA